MIKLLIEANTAEELQEALEVLRGDIRLAGRLEALVQKLHGSTAELAGALNQPPKPQEETLTMSVQPPPGPTPSALDAAIAALTTEVAAVTTVDGSATVYINGVPKLIADAVAAATAAGATPTQLKAITDLGTALEAASGPLKAALTANTTTPPAVG